MQEEEDDQRIRGSGGRAGGRPGCDRSPCQQAGRAHQAATSARRSFRAEGTWSPARRRRERRREEESANRGDTAKPPVSSGFGRGPTETCSLIDPRCHRSTVRQAGFGNLQGRGLQQRVPLRVATTYEDLALVGGVGQVLNVTNHAGVEHNLARDRGLPENTAFVRYGLSSVQRIVAHD
eukprot:607425-Rhodomonas_salina.4